MNIIHKNEGPKIPYSARGSKITFDDEVTYNLTKYERDEPCHIDLCRDKHGNLVSGVIPGTAERYVAQIDIPARGFTEKEVENPDYDAENEDGGEESGMSGKSPTIIQKDPIPFSMDNVTLTLYALKEGVF